MCVCVRVGAFASAAPSAFPLLSHSLLSYLADSSPMLPTSWSGPKARSAPDICPAQVPFPFLCLPPHVYGLDSELSLSEC